VRKSIPIVIGVSVLAASIIGVYIFTTFRANESISMPAPNDLPRTTPLDILDQYRPKGHSLAIIPTKTDIATNRVFGNATVGNPTGNTFEDCQFQFVSTKNVNGTLATNGTSITVLKQYATMEPHFIESVSVPSMHYYKGDKLVLECKNPSDSVESPLYLP
jgi:hypothetical protein